MEHFQPYEEIAATASKWSVQYIMFNASLEHWEILTMEIIKTSKNAFFQKTKVTLAWNIEFCPHIEWGNYFFTHSMLLTASVAESNSTSHFQLPLSREWIFFLSYKQLCISDYFCSSLTTEDKLSWALKSVYCTQYLKNYALHVKSFQHMNFAHIKEI